MNWDDLKTAVAVFQAGSFFSAAARLGVDETTVSRRITRLERAVGFPIFEAIDGKRTPTQRGQELLRRANLMSAEASAIGSLLDAVPDTTTYRIATTDSLAVELFGPAVPDLLDRNPDIRLSFLASTENVNFSRWEADFAVRLKQPEKGDFIVSKLGDLQFFLVEPNGPDENIFFVSYPDELISTPEAQWLQHAGYTGCARCISKNLLVHKGLIQTGRAKGILPSFLCAEFAKDPRFTLQKLEITREIWLLIQPHMHSDPKANAVSEWLRAAVRNCTKK